MSSYRVSSERRMKTRAEEVAAIEDLLIHILRRLPTKTLLKFKLVSKGWLSLISSSDFSTSHTRFLFNEGSLKPSAFFVDVIYKQPPTKFLFLHLYPDTKRPSLDFIDAPYFKVLQSCTGLLLCTSDHGNLSYFICNPVIKKFKMVSFPRPPSLEYQLVGVNLAFNPLKSPYYHIICVWQEAFVEKDEENNCIRYMTFDFSIDIYSSETDSWSVSRIKFTSDCSIKFDHAVFFNGAIHWDSATNESLYFDMETRRLMPMPMPKPKRRYSGCRYFGESGGCLHLVVGRTPLSHLTFRIYEMFKDYSDWYLKYHIDLIVEIGGFNIRQRFRIFDDYELFWLTMHYDEDEGDLLILVLQGGVTICFKFEDQELEILGNYPKADKYPHDYERFRACPYFETLSCV